MLAGSLWASSASALTICGYDYTEKPSVSNSYANQGYIVLRVQSSTCTTGARYDIVLPTLSQYATVCDIAATKIPNGYAITARSETSNCSKDLNPRSSYTLTKISGSSMIVCDGTKVPSGWVITRRSTYNQCSKNIGGGPGQLIVKAVNSNYIICDDVNLIIPPGYVITRKSSTSSCAFGSNSTGPSMTISVVTGTSIWTCDSTSLSLPAGYVFNEYRSSLSGCGSGGTSGPAWKLVQVQGSGPILSCKTTDPFLPLGWVITERKIYTQCDNRVGATIRKPSSGTLNVCDGSPLPPGFVITARRSTFSQCAYTTGASKYGYTIQLPTNGLVVCEGSPVPDGWGFNSSGPYAQCNPNIGTSLGYKIFSIPPEGAVVCWADGANVPTGMVIVGIDDYPQCNSTLGGHTGYTLKTPQGGGVSTDVCLGSTIPSGFVLSQYKSSYPLCGNLQQGFTIRQPSVSGNTIVCVGSPVPVGYVVSAISNYAQCSGSLSNQGFTIFQPSGSGPFTVCYTSSIPVGMVIIAEGVAAQCSASSSSGTGFTIAFPNATGTTVICNTSPIPTGFENVGATSAPNCTGGGGRIIRPIVTAINPAEFVNSEINVVPGTVPAESYQCNNTAVQGGFLQGASANLASCP